MRVAFIDETNIMGGGLQIIFNSKFSKVGIEIGAFEENNICISGKTLKQVEKLIRGYKKVAEKEDIDLEDYLRKKGIYFEFMSTGTYSKEDFIRVYGDFVIISDKCFKVFDAESYYNLFEEYCFCRFIDNNRNLNYVKLVNRGEEVWFIDTIEKGEDYSKDLFYNYHDDVYLVIYNSYGDGYLESLPMVEKILNKQDVPKEFRKY